MGAGSTPLGLDPDTQSAGQQEARVDPAMSSAARPVSEKSLEDRASAAVGAGTLEAERQGQRLRWQCRRGMLELDLLLNRFLDQRYADLDPAGRADFERLLGYQDQILQDWLIGQAVPADPALSGLVVAIQGCMLEGSRASPIGASADGR